MHVMMCFNMNIDLDPRPRLSQYIVQTRSRSTWTQYSLVGPMDIDQVVQVKSPTHRRAVDLPGA